MHAFMDLAVHGSGWTWIKSRNSWIPGSEEFIILATHGHIALVLYVMNKCLMYIWIYSRLRPWTDDIIDISLGYMASSDITYCQHWIRKHDYKSPYWAPLRAVRIPPITFTRMFEPRRNILSNVRAWTLESMLCSGSNVRVKVICHYRDQYFRVDRFSRKIRHVVLATKYFRNKCALDYMKSGCKIYSRCIIWRRLNLNLTII